ncbi:cache domain-containing protein [Massilia sp. W12]|uniref:protein kinase domain-containing protein n=1 Tax=Massilia sp. W12 TaxID=3126507 RepID=UPI0030CE2FD5
MTHPSPSSDAIHNGDQTEIQPSHISERLAKLESALQLERKLRRVKDEEAEELRHKLKEALEAAEQARNLPDPEATVFSKTLHMRHSTEAANQDVTDADAPTRMMTAWLPPGGKSQSLSHPRSHSISTRSITLTEPAPGVTPNALPAGFMLHEYRIDSVLGQGGFGITYLATDINLNTKVAIKEYLPAGYAYRDGEYAVHPKSHAERDFYLTGLDQFLVEARTLATFRHPNIVRVARFFESHHTAYIVLEYERGQPLRGWWRHDKPLGEEELLALLQPLCDGLAMMHEAGFLHRDIKPDNIYVRKEDGSLVLLDFGAAKQQGQDQQDPAAIVTPGYAPPEQYEQSEQGPYSDIYSLCATLYWMLSGRKPPPAPERMSGQSETPSIQSLCAGQYSEAMLRAIDWGLELDKNNRPQSIQSFAQALFAAHSSSLGLQAALAREDDSKEEKEKRFALRASWKMLLNSPQLLRRRISHMWQSYRRPANWPLALKMTLALMLAALLPMSITAYYNLQGSMQTVASSESRNLERLAQSVAGRISQLLADNRGLASYLATDPEFINYLRSPNESGRRNIEEKIYQLLKTNPDVHRLLLIDKKGLVLVSSDPAVTGKNASMRDYFRSAMAGRPFVTGMLLSLADNSPGVFYSNPVYDPDGNAIGVVVLRIKGVTIDNLLTESTEGTGRIPFLIDGDGVMISHPDRAYLYQSLNTLSEDKQKEIVSDQRFGKERVKSLNMPELAQAMVHAKKHGSVTYHSVMSQKPEHAGFSPVLGHNWVVGITEPRSQFEAPLRRLFSHVMYSVVAVGLVFLLLAVWFARSIVRPVLRLTDAAIALKEGDFAKATIKVESNDEIGRLARTFNVMIDVLRQREREKNRSRGHHH